MSKVFVNIALSLDGYMAPEGMSVEHWHEPTYMDWGAKWGALMAWILKQQYFRDNLKFGPGGETGPVNDLVRATTERIGANVMGKRMFDQGALSWPEEAPFHTPVFVLTHHHRPSFTLSDTTFHFIDATPHEALEQAKLAADGRDVRLGGGVATVRQFLEADLVDTIHVAVAPVELGDGERLWATHEELLDRFHLDVVPSPSGVTHLIFWRR